MKKKRLVCVLAGLLVAVVAAVAFWFIVGFKNDATIEIAEDAPEVENLDIEIVELVVPDPLETALRSEKYFIERRLTRYLNYIELHPELTMTQIVKEINCDFDKIRYQDVTNADLSYGELSLVSKYYYLDHYEPDDLIELGRYSSGRATKMQKTAGEAFIRMADAAAADGLIIKNISGYRSYDYQNTLYKNYAARDGYAGADTYSSRPGYSEHQTGLATDINSVDSSFENTAEFRWLQQHAIEYGFILRYPKGLEDITGFVYEPWHYRYVGVEAAEQIVREGLTFEEYYAYYIER